MEQLYEPYIIKKKRTKKFWINIVIFITLLVVLCFFLLFKFLNLSVFGWLFAGKNEDENQIDFHFVAKNAVNSQTSASEMAKTYRARGAAGIVFNYGGVEYVVLSCFYNLQDATNVAKRLNATEVDIEVFSLQVKKPNDSNLEEEDKNSFNTVFNFLKEIVTKLDSIILNLSNEKLTDVSANLQMNNLLLKSKFYQQKLLENDKLETTSYVLSCVTSILEYVCGETALSENYLSYQAEIRRAYVRICVVIYESLLNLTK